jgi:CxxC motif-containing protein (DUF1111 family)
MLELDYYVTLYDIRVHKRKSYLRTPNRLLCAGLAIWLLLLGRETMSGQTGVAEAPTGFANATNGAVSQAQFDDDRATFEEVDTVEKGLGPVYNAQSCAECHQNPVTGAGSQVTVLRAGHFDGQTFTASPGGSLIHDRAIDPAIQERVGSEYEVRAFRISVSILGDGYIECLDDRTIEALAAAQPAAMRGEVVRVPVLEAPGTTRVGRFGWKNQHASLLSFAADAYLNEMGITNRLQLTENTSNGRSVAAFDTVADASPNGEDVDNDIDAFARFMRATQAPPRDVQVSAFSSDAMAGSALFDAVGCATCHVRDLTTAPAGTAINGGTFTVPAALGSKRIHPFSDFLVHDVGTGDGIVQNGAPSTRNKMRTPPLWGLRARGRLMHDGMTVTRHEAIVRHDGEARGVVALYNTLSPTQKSQLIVFLNSL